METSHINNNDARAIFIKLPFYTFATKTPGISNPTSIAYNFQ